VFYHCATAVGFAGKAFIRDFFHFILRITSDGKIFTKSLTCMASGSSSMVEHSIADPEF
jgi:hypothetical protein